MTATYKEATDDMYAVAFAGIKASQPLFGYVPQVVWNNNGPTQPPDPSKVWVRVGRSTVDEGQATLSTDEGLPGQRKYDSTGMLWIQAFLPRADPNAATYADEFSVTLRNAFRGISTPNAVWFKNARIVEVAPEVETVRFNVVTEFNYSEIF